MIFIHFSAEINSIQTNKYPTIMGWYNPTFQKHYYPHWFHPLPTPPPPQPPSPPAAHLLECLNLQYLLRIHVSEYTYTYSWAATSRTPQWVNLVQILEVRLTHSNLDHIKCCPNRYINTIISINKTQRKKKNLPMAQAMPDVSFGPIFITHLPWAIKNRDCV